MAVAAFSCSGPDVAPAIMVTPPRTVVSDPLRRVSLGARCAPTGIEICFDAVDQNCDGTFDEGCGLPDGALQLVAAWPVADADVELEVIDPHGELAAKGQATTAGLQKDRDCPREPDECGGQNVEVVALEGDRVPKGRYLVTLRLKRSGTSSGAVTVRLGGHIGSEAVTGSWTLTRDEPAARFEIERIEPGVRR
jgi:tRNA (guanosine-2'-O-)-methyltransferase